MQEQPAGWGENSAPVGIKYDVLDPRKGSNSPAVCLCMCICKEGEIKERRKKPMKMTGRLATAGGVLKRAEGKREAGICMFCMYSVSILPLVCRRLAALATTARNSGDIFSTA